MLLSIAQLAPIPSAATGASGLLDPNVATQAYLATMSAADRARSNAYFEGGYWLILFDFLVASIVYLILLQTGLSTKLRDWTQRFTRFRAAQDFLYWIAFLAFTFVLSLPMTIYEGYVREHQYNLSNMTFGAWFKEQLEDLGITALLGGIALMVLYAVVRKVGKSWWVWGAGVFIAFAAFGAIIAPVVIEPIFNKYKPLDNPAVTQPILSLAHANGINVDKVMEVDASKQSKRVSANVAGFGSTMRIALNDNLLARCSLEEIEAVMGHEMGHYVLNHIYKGLLAIGVLIAIGFALTSWLYERLRARWKIRDIGDTAGLPLIALIIGAYFFVLTPVNNSITRTMEYEADLFGLNAARQPDGMAQVALKLAEYRKLDPGPLEEIFFYDHPSGRVRIFSAMRWKASHPETWAPSKGTPPATN
jgi:STE24 endopeptidase